MADSPETEEPSMEEILASIRRIIADEKNPEKEPEAASETKVEDVLELTQMVQDDGSVVDLAAPPPSAPEEPPVKAEEPPPPLPPPPEDVLPPMPELPPAPPMPEEPLVSEKVADSASSSLSTLASTVQIERLAANATNVTLLGNGARTLEEMVTELMRPAVKEWLDQNLSSLVERLVQKEIERIVRRAQD